MTAHRFIAPFCWLSMMMMAATPANAGAAHIRLDNGLDLVVIEDRRAPVVTHIIGYRAGSADEPLGQSGVAHFVEHMLFKATRTRKAGDYARLIARFGGSSNAVTTHDATIYHARVPKEQLGLVMSLEAERMRDAVFDEHDVETERGVILAERRGRIDSAPLNVLAEKIDAAMYASHPYGLPSIGLEAGVRSIRPSHIETFYRRHYVPAAAFVVVAGDVMPDDVRAAAVSTYGAVPAANRANVPETLQDIAGAGDAATRSVQLEDRRVARPVVYRLYDVPSRRTGGARTAAALEILANILTSGQGSRLADILVVQGKMAVSTDGGYLALRRDRGQLALYAAAAPGIAAGSVERALDEAIASLQKAGVTGEELARAKASLHAHRAFEGDNQLALARRYADGLAAGLTIAEIESWPDAVAAVSAADVMEAARRHLLRERAVTGYLLPQAKDAAGGRSEAPR